MMRAAAVLVALAACGAADPPPAPPPPQKPSVDPWEAHPPAGPPIPTAHEVTVALREFTEQMCACRDNDCFARVANARNKYMHDLHRQGAVAVLEKDRELVASAENEKVRMAACLKDILKPDPNWKDPLVTKKLDGYVGLRDAMCACKDRPCSERVRADMNRHIDELGHVQLGDEDEARMKGLLRELLACQVKAVTK